MRWSDPISWIRINRVQITQRRTIYTGLLAFAIRFGLVLFSAVNKSGGEDDGHQDMGLDERSTHRIYLCLHGHDDPVLCVAIARAAVEFKLRPHTARNVSLIWFRPRTSTIT